MSINGLQRRVGELQKVVDGWREGEEIATIEMDMALERVKKIYEMLRFPENLKCEAKEQPEVEAESLSQPEVVPQPEPEVVLQPEVEVEPQPEPEPEPQPKPSIDEERIKKQERRNRILSLYGEPEFVVEPIVEEQKVEATVIEEPEVNEEVCEDVNEEVEVAVEEEIEEEVTNEPEPESIEEIIFEEIEIEEDEEDEEVETEEEETEVAGEQEEQEEQPEPIVQEITSCGTTIHTHNSISSQLGFNDRLLLANDLFDGDMEALNTLIETLEQQPSLDDAILYIAENYTWSGDQDGAKLLYILLENRFL